MLVEQDAFAISFYVDTLEYDRGREEKKKYFEDAGSTLVAIVVPPLLYLSYVHCLVKQTVAIL